MAGRAASTKDAPTCEVAGVAYYGRVDAARIMKLSTSTLDRMIRVGTLAAFIHKGRVLIRCTDVEAYNAVKPKMVQPTLPGLEHLLTDPSKVRLTDEQASAVARVMDDQAVRKRRRRVA